MIAIVMIMTLRKNKNDGYSTGLGVTHMMVGQRQWGAASAWLFVWLFLGDIKLIFHHFECNFDNHFIILILLYGLQDELIWHQIKKKLGAARS